MICADEENAAAPRNRGVVPLAGRLGRHAAAPLHRVKRMQNRHGKPPTVKLKPSGTHRCLTGHSWVFDNEIVPPDDLAPGAEVDVVDHRGRFVGRGYYNAASKIRIRIFTHSSTTTLDRDFFAKRIRQARAIRTPFLPEDEPRRVVFSEGDRLPGVVADLYGRTLVVQILTLGMEARRELIFETLVEAYRPTGVFERSDVASRQKEGLPPRSEVVYGDVPDAIEVATDGVRFSVDPRAGHKTGAYLDQRFNRRRFAAFAPGRRVLDAFAYHGLFGCYAGFAGAGEVTAIESSPEACRAIAANAELNGRAFEILEENAFDALKRLETEGARFDLISLDPPSFTRAAAGTEGAARGYKEINMRAMRLLSDDGLLFTSSCSYHTSREEFLATLASAAYDSKRNLRLIEILGASPDHPVRLEVPETDYLKCAVLKAAPGLEAVPPSTRKSTLGGAAPGSGTPPPAHRTPSMGGKA
jgi:23S rRNA (cytosine1962-C5)-methyltransferase